MAKAATMRDGQSWGDGPGSLGAGRSRGPSSGKCGAVGRAASTQAVTRPRPLPLPWPHLVGPARWQDGEASQGLGAGQDHTAAAEPEQDVVGGPARKPTAPKRTWRRKMSRPRFCRSKTSP